MPKILRSGVGLSTNLAVTKPHSGNKYIGGWMSLHEGAEAEFAWISKPYIAAYRAEPECCLFEMVRTREDPMKVLICELSASSR